MYPPVSSSRVITSRRMVVFPEPEGPISVTRSPRSTEKLRSLRTTLLPKRFSTSVNWITGVSDSAAGADAVTGVSPGLELESVGVGKTLLQSVDQKGCGIARNQEDDPGDRDGFVVSEGLSADGLGDGDHLRNADDKKERCVFEHRNGVVAEGRDG